MTVLEVASTEGMSRRCDRCRGTGSVKQQNGNILVDAYKNMFSNICLTHNTVTYPLATFLHSAKFNINYAINVILFTFGSQDKKLTYTRSLCCDEVWSRCC